MDDYLKESQKIASEGWTLFKDKLTALKKGDVSWWEETVSVFNSYANKYKGSRYFTIAKYQAMSWLHGLEEAWKENGSGSGT